MKVRVAASTEGTISATRPRDRAVQAVDFDLDALTDPDEAQARLVDRGLQTQVAFALHGEQRRSRRRQAAGIGLALGDQAGEGRGERGVAEGHTRRGDLGFGLAAARLRLPALRDGHFERRLGALEPRLRFIEFLLRNGRFGQQVLEALVGHTRQFDVRAGGGDGVFGLGNGAFGFGAAPPRRGGGSPRGCRGPAR